MKLLLLAALFSWSSAYQNCPQVTFNFRCYNIQILKEGVSNIHQLIFNDNDNTLYFTFDQIAEIPSKGLGFFNIIDQTTGIIEGIRNATGVAIDKKHNRIYVGGADGLFFLHENKVPEKLPVQDNIQYLFFKDVVYFANRRKQAFKFDYGLVIPIPELQGQAVDKFVLDDGNNILFLQDYQIFSVKVGTRSVNAHDNYRANTLSTDFNYKPFIGTSNGVYVYNKYKYALDKISKLVDLRELTFTRQGEPIYVVMDNIVKLYTSTA